MDYNFMDAAYEICRYAAPAIAGLIIVKSTAFQVNQQTAAIVETFGKFSRVAAPGLRFKLPLISKVAQIMPLRLGQSDFDVEVRTKDNAFVNVPVSLHHKITDPQKAYYELANPVQQMESFASNVVRAKGAQMTLSELYEAQDAIKQAIKDTLDKKIGLYGFEIEDVVVSQPNPSSEVKAAFDRVISSQRALEAAKNEAEAGKIKTVKAAEAEAEAMQAYGRGIANQRIEIAKGNKTALEEMGESVSPELGLALMVMTNGQEALVKASNNKASVILGSTRGENSLDELQTLAARLGALSKPRVIAQSNTPRPV